MKFDSYAFEQLHYARGSQNFVKVVCYNKYGHRGLVRARVKEVYPDAILLDFNTSFESSHKNAEQVYALFYTNLEKKEKGIFAKKGLRKGFLIESIISDARNEIFHNDEKTMKTATKLFEENCEKDNRFETDIANDPRYSLYNQFIGDRVIIEKNFKDGRYNSFSGVMQYASRYNPEKITVSLIVGDMEYDCAIVPNRDNFIVRHANGETSQIYSLPVEEDLTDSQRNIFEKLKKNGEVSYFCKDEEELEK